MDVFGSNKKGLKLQGVGKRSHPRILREKVSKGKEIEKEVKR